MGSILKISFASKEAHPLVTQLEKITVKKVQAKVVKCAKINLGSLGVHTPNSISYTYAC